MLNDTIMATIFFWFDRGEDNNVIWKIERISSFAHVPIVDRGSGRRAGFHPL